MSFRKIAKKTAIPIILFVCMTCLLFKNDFTNPLAERNPRFSEKLGNITANISNTIIPKIIHQTWKSDNIYDINVPNHVRESVKAWNTYSPTFTCLLWNDNDIEGLVINDYPDLHFLYKRLTPVMRADLFRLLVLHKYGGIVSFLYSQDSIRTPTLFLLLIQMNGLEIQFMNLTLERLIIHQRNLFQ